VPGGRLAAAVFAPHPKFATVEVTGPDDSFPGRLFTRWDAAAFTDLLTGAGFEVDSIDEVPQRDGDVLLISSATRARTLPDIVGPGMRLLVCGLNPSLYAADAGVGYARPGNRFWPAALQAGIVSVDRDPRHALRHHAVGFTDLVKRATPAAAELTAAEYTAGLARLDRLCELLAPAAVAFCGLSGWRAAVDKKATTGWQDHLVGGRPAYVLPNPAV